MIHAIIDTLVHFADIAGYAGIYLYMVLVGTFIPVPSEIVLIPAGYLASLGQKSFTLTLLFGAAGSLTGALINYLFALHLIRRLFSHKPAIRKIITFFQQHGKISVFLAPLTPGMGQYISIPAGLSHMPMRHFIPLTFAANLIWVGFMLLIGYIFGEGDTAKKSAAWFSLVLLGFVIVSVSIYVWRRMRQIDTETMEG